MHYTAEQHRLLHPDNREVGRKLGLATGFMFTLPIATFFIVQYLCQNFTSPDNWAGGAAIIMTNIIVGVYCYQAYMEDQNDDSKDSRGIYDKDSDAPRVGIYKQRTD
jgi:VMA21-like domain